MRRKSGTVLMIALIASMLLVGLMMVVAILDPIEIEVVYANEIETTELDVETEAETETETETDTTKISDEEKKEIQSEIDYLNSEGYGDFDIDRGMLAMNYFITYQHLSPEGAAGIVGNMYAESRLKPEANNGSYIGICQWDASIRWPRISAWLAENGYSYDSFEGQLTAIFESTDADYYQDVFSQMKDMSDETYASLVWLNDYEVAPGQAEDVRQKAAMLALDYFQLI